MTRFRLLPPDPHLGWVPYAWLVYLSFYAAYPILGFFAASVLAVPPVFEPVLERLSAAYQLGYIDAATWQRWRDAYQDVAQMLQGLRRSIGRSSRSSDH